MNRNFAFAIAAVVLVAIVGIAILLPQQPAESHPSTGNITLATYPNQLPALIYIARDQHFFSEEGLNVSIRFYPSGAAAVDAVLKKEADIGLASEYVFARNVMSGQNITALGTVAKTQDIYIIGRTDRGIRNPADLIGKRIGLPKGTATEFYLDRFVTMRGIPSGNISIVNVPTDQISDSLANGTVDGVVIVQPVAGLVKDRLGEDVVMWPAQGGQAYYWTLTSREGWAGDHAGEVGRFFEALVRAENYLNNNPQSAKSIVIRDLDYDEADLGQVWEESQFSLALDQSFVSAMEDEARWMIENNLTQERSLPDFRKFISTKSLEKIKPGSVRIIG